MIYGETRTPGALCLSRRKGEKILIGDDIEVMVAKVHNGRVYLAIRAPKHLAVDREEVREAKRRSSREGSGARQEDHRDGEGEMPEGMDS